MQYLLVISFLGYFIGISNPIMEIDAMQYASIARELLRNDNILHFFDNGNPYLDKPPLIFWMNALGYKIFGVSNWSYRIPSIFFSIIAIYSTFQFSVSHYSKQTAMLAAIILSSCTGFFIMNSDVRTDMYMIGPMMVAIWQLDLYCKNFQWKNLIFGSIAISFSMMGKGPIGILIPFITIVLDQISRKKLKYIINEKLLISLLIILLCLFPMTYGLFTQFGLKGVKFFYWTNSFGRITGSSSWSNDTGAFYLFSVFLYAFLPWTFIFLGAYIKRLRSFFIRKKVYINKLEIISFVGFTVPLIMLSLSSYKLPHYIYCILPFAAILTADMIEKNGRNKGFNKYIFLTQIITLTMMLIFVYFVSHIILSKNIYFYIFPFLIIIIFIWIYINLRKDLLAQLIVPSIAGYLLFNYGFNMGIINPLLGYQAPSKAANYLLQNEKKIKNMYLYDENEKAKSRAFNFYLNINTKYINQSYLKSQVFSKPILIYTGSKGYEQLIEYNKNIKILKTFDHVRVSKLRIDFFNPETRGSITEKKYLLKLF